VIEGIEAISVEISLSGSAAGWAEWLRLSGRTANSSSLSRRLRLHAGQGSPTAHLGVATGREPGLHAPREYKNEGITPEVIEKTRAAFSRSGSLAGDELGFKIRHSGFRTGKFGASVDV
jgi:hypothetical protein